MPGVFKSKADALFFGERFSATSVASISSLPASFALSKPLTLTMTRRISRGLNCDRDSSACSEGNSGNWQAAGSLKRSDLLPDIPAIAEELPGFEMVG